MIILKKALANRGYNINNYGIFWRDLQTHLIELVYKDGMYHPTVTEYPSHHTESEQSISLKPIKTFDELDKIEQVII